MIRIKKNINILRDTIKIIENINPEIDFVFCPEGIIVKAIDPSAISIGLFKIKKEMFEEYEITEQKIYTFQVNLLSKILKKVGKKELTISFEENKVNFTTSTDSFSLKFFVGNKDNRPEPEFEGDSQWSIDTTEFFNHIKDYAEFSEVIKIESKEGKLYLGTKSNLLEGQSLTNSVFKKSEDATCWYSLPNFTMISNTRNIFDDMSLEFSINKPCIMTAENDFLKFKWILAPRVEE